MSRRGLLRGERRKLATVEREARHLTRRGLGPEHPFIDQLATRAMWLRDDFRRIGCRYRPARRYRR